MISLNAFADRMGTSYASAHNAQIALDRKALRDSSYGTAVIERTDGRFAAIIINPDVDAFHFYVHCTNLGVYGVSA